MVPDGIAVTEFRLETENFHPCWFKLKLISNQGFMMIITHACSQAYLLAFPLQILELIVALLQPQV